MTDDLPIVDKKKASKRNLNFDDSDGETKKEKLMEESYEFVPP
jgi:hypothetical protein